MKVLQQIIVTINTDQIKALLDHIGQTDWWGVSVTIFSQFIAVAIAAFSGYYFQKIFRRSDEIEIKRNNIYAFNEAVAFIGVLLENYVSRLETLIVAEFYNEKHIYEKIESDEKIQKLPLAPLIASFKAIWPIDILNAADVLNKVSTIGKHIDLALAFNRLRHSMVQSAQICEERNIRIRQFIEMPKTNITQIFLRCGEIYNLTQNLLMNEEAIFDAAIYISNGLIRIGEELKLAFKAITNEEMFIAKIANSEIYKDVLLRVNELVDQNPEFAQRFLHLRHTDIAGAIVKDNAN